MGAPLAVARTIESPYACSPWCLVAASTMAKIPCLMAAGTFGQAFAIVSRSGGMLALLVCPGESANTLSTRPERKSLWSTCSADVEFLSSATPGGSSQVSESARDCTENERDLLGSRSLPSEWRRRESNPRPVAFQCMLLRA